MAFLYLIVTLVLLSGVNPNPINQKADVALDLIILHNNDMHARFEQTSVSSGKCSKEDANTHKCYGGFARVAYEVRKYRQEAEQGGTPIVYLNAGDTYTGTPWFTVFKDNITTAFLNKLKPDAISLGNHEFDEGVERLIPFLNNVECPVLAANLNLSRTPELTQTKHLANYTILEVNGTKVGVIGYLTPDTKFVAAANTVEYIPEIEAINAEAAKLKAQGIKIIIALGHSGYQKDQEIAAKCPDVDIVIGGHSHTFLYSGKKPDAEDPEGPYPTVVKRSNGVEVPVVQAYAYTKYLGKIHVQFDKDGNLIEFDGTPILLNASIEQENDVLELLEVYRPTIDDLEKEVVGYTKVYLDATVCRKEECNLGNLIADAWIHTRVLQNASGAYWTDAPIALIQGGGIRGSIEKRSDGRVLGADILTTQPFSNELLITKLSGKTLRQALEHSADVRGTDSDGGFLQMSGLYVTYNYEEKKGSRVVNVQARCGECDVPHYEPLNDTRMYQVIIQQFLFDGGDGYVLKEKDTVPIFMKTIDAESLRAYFKARQYVYPEIEGRISIVAKDSAAGLASSAFVLFIALVLRQFL